MNSKLQTDTMLCKHLSRRRAFLQLLSPAHKCFRKSTYDIENIDKLFLEKYKKIEARCVHEPHASVSTAVSRFTTFSRVFP